MATQSSRSALRASWKPLLQTSTTRDQCACMHRCFSTTLRNRRHGAVPALTVSESAPAELSDLLQKIRDNIFLPAHLKRPQKKLVYKTKLQRILETDPVTVTLGDDDFTLQPVNRLKDEPHSWKSMQHAMELMGSSKENWRGSFVGLLEGFRTAGRQWKPWQWETLMRKAAYRQGMVGVVIEAAKRRDRTGLALIDVRTVREIFWGCRSIALGVPGDVEGETGAASQEEIPPWDEERTKQALRYAERVAELMDMPGHCGDVVFVGPKMDPRAQPDCIGAVLELAATRAEQHLDGVDEGRKVLGLTERLLANLETGLDQDMEEQDPVGSDPNLKTARADYDLMRWIPVKNGLETAMRVLGEKQMPRAEHAEARLKRLQSLVDERIATVTHSPSSKVSNTRRGLKWAKGL